MATAGKIALGIAALAMMEIVGVVVMPMLLPTTAPEAWISDCRTAMAIPGDRIYAPSPKTEFLAIHVPSGVVQLDVRRGVAVNVSRRFYTHELRRLADGRYLVPLPTDDGSKLFTVLDARDYSPIYPSSGGTFRPADLERRATGCGLPPP